VNKKDLNNEHFTRLVNFRQQIRACFLKRGEALSSLLDAVKQTSHLNSFVELSLAPCFRHRWQSVYAALDDSLIDSKQVNLLCLAQVPERDSLYFALDVMNVRRAASETLKDLMICHGAKREAFGNGVVLGLPYSLLAFCENASSSWAMTVNTQRVKPEQKAVLVAVEQIEWLFENIGLEKEVSVGLDGSYGNLGFFTAIKGKKGFAVARMRNDRVLYRRPREPDGKPGRDPKYGEKFKFNEPESLGEAEEVLEFEDSKHGQVRLEKWSQKRFRQAGEVVEIEVVRSQIHLEKEKAKRPAAKWYGIHNQIGKPTQLKRCYLTAKHRWTIEPANGFKKERLYADKPMFRKAENSDKWLEISQVLEWEIYLWKKLAKDERMPWQKELSEEKLTPGRVLRSLASNLSEVAGERKEVLPRGKASGWEKGRPRSRPMKYKIELKGKKKAKKEEQKE
jgi:hypothetical protein